MAGSSKGRDFRPSASPLFTPVLTGWVNQMNGIVIVNGFWTRP